MFFFANLKLYLTACSLLFSSVLSVHLTSSKSLVGITGVIAEIQQEKKVSVPFFFLIESLLHSVS
jgi:hypothetical protein